MKQKVKCVKENELRMKNKIHKLKREIGKCETAKAKSIKTKPFLK